MKISDLLLQVNYTVTLCFWMVNYSPVLSEFKVLQVPLGILMMYNSP